jgi:hypothetical protein
VIGKDAMSHARRRSPRPPRSPLLAGHAGALGLALFAAAGCSFTVIRPSPVRADWPDPVTPHSSQMKCTRSPAPPLLDTGVALTFGTLAYIERDSGARWFTPLASAAAVPFVASALYGYWMTGRCRSYQSLFQNDGGQK